MEDLAPLVAAARRQAVRLAAKAGHPHLADELESAAMVGLAHAVDTWRPTGGQPFRAWARWAMEHACRQAVRDWAGRGTGRKPEAGRDDPTDTLGRLRSGEDPEAACLDAEATAELSALIAGLDARARDVLWARERGETLEDVARRWGVSASRLSQVRSRTLDQLARRREAA